MGGDEIAGDPAAFGVAEARYGRARRLGCDLLDAVVDAEDVAVAHDAEEQQQDRRDEGELDCASDALVSAET